VTKEVKFMPKQCAITGRQPTRGRTYCIRGIAKKKKGIGLKVTAKSKRTFKPNLSKRRIWDPERKRFVSLLLSAAALRTLNKKGYSATLKTVS
jgi:large subunit ribosomal protein L28